MHVFASLPTETIYPKQKTRKGLYVHLGDHNLFETMTNLHFVLMSGEMEYTY